MGDPRPVRAVRAGRLAGAPARAAREARRSSRATPCCCSASAGWPGLGLAHGARRGRAAALAGSARASPCAACGRSRCCSLFTVVVNALRWQPGRRRSCGSGRSASSRAGLATGLFFAARIVAAGDRDVAADADDLAGRADRRAVAAHGPAARRSAFPVDDVAMMFSIALRFIPTTAEEAEKIVVAQSARGARFDEGGPVAARQGVGAGARPAVREPVPPRRRPGHRDGVALLHRAAAARGCTSLEDAGLGLDGARAGRDRRARMRRYCSERTLGGAPMRRGSRAEPARCRSVSDITADDPVIALTVAYDGAPFAGFARQPGQRHGPGRASSRRLRPRCAARSTPSAPAARMPASTRSARSSASRATATTPTPASLAALAQRADGDGHRRARGPAARGRGSRHGSMRSAREYRYRIVRGSGAAAVLGAGRLVGQAASSTRRDARGRQRSSSASTTSARSA